MENKADTQCDRCGRFFVGARGLSTHQRIGTRCVLIQEGPDITKDLAAAIDNFHTDFPFHILDTSDEERVPPLIEIEGYSLEYLNIPADLFHNLENEKLELGRFESLQSFAQLATANQTRSLDYIFRFFYIILYNIFWFSRILCIISLCLAFYYTNDNSCSTLINNFVLDIEKRN